MSDPNSPIQATLSGDIDIVAAFRDLRDYLPHNALRRAVRSAADLMRRWIALAAPILTGRLSRDIAVRTASTSNAVDGRVVVSTAGERNSDSNAFYWRFLEEGFHTRRGQMVRYPFVAGVFDAKNIEVAQEVIDACEQAIDRAEAKARGSL